MTDEPPPPDAAPEGTPEPLRCPSCLAPVEADQEFCLECGARLDAPEPRRRGWLVAPLWLAAAAILLLLGGFGIAWGFTRGSDSGMTAATGSVSGPPTATFTASPTSQIGSQTSSIPSITGNSTVTATVTVSTGSTGSTSTGTTSSDCGGEPTSADTDSWPNGQNGWMAILWSKSTTTHTFADACQRLHTAQSQGYTNLGIVDSSDYGSLRPGYWVVYQGPYSTSQAAASEAQQAQQDWPGAYPREINDAL